MDQPGKVANPARGQLNRENEYFPVPVRACEVMEVGTMHFTPQSVYQALRYSAKLSFATGQGVDVCC